MKQGLTLQTTHVFLSSVDSQATGQASGEVERSIELDVSFLTYYGLDFFKVPSRGYSYNHKSLKIVKIFLRFCPGAKKRDPVRHVKGQC